MAMELILKQSEVTIPQAIENIEYLKAELIPKMQYYSSLVVTEDSIKDAKVDKANLNKLKKAIDEQRIAAKKQCLALYAPLEKQCKELVSMIDAPILAIDKQIKNFDDIRKQEKYNTLKAHFEEVNTLDFVNFEDVLNPKWGNATAKIEALKEEISASVQKISSEYEEIKVLYKDSPLLTAILERYAESHDKSSALAYAVILEKKEQARQAGELVEKSCNQSIKAESDVKITQPVEQPDEPIGTASFKVTCTRSQLIQLREYMKSNNIRFEVIR